MLWQNMNWPSMLLKNGKVKDCVIVQIVRGIVRRTPMRRGTLDPWFKSRVGPIFLRGSIDCTGLT